MAEERGLVVDVEGFDRAMHEARERSRSAQTKVLVCFHFLVHVHISLNSVWYVGYAVIKY